MRIIGGLLLFGFVSSAMAITKCELNDKVTYKNGSCPENASSKFLIKDEFVEEKQLLKHKQKRVEQSEKDFKRMNAPRVHSNENKEWFQSENQQVNPKKVPVSKDTHQAEKIDKVESKQDKINAPKMYDGVNGKLSEMEQKLEQHNKELQQLQNQ